MAIYFNKKEYASDHNVKRNYDEVGALRNFFNNSQKLLAKQAPGIDANATALISKEYYREVDNITARVMRDDNGNELLAEIFSLGDNINIGKTVSLYRVSSDTGIVTRSMSGQVPEQMSNVIYDYYGDPIPIFSTGYGREWRENLGLMSENFDAIADDQETHVSAIKRDMANYILRGDEKFSVKGYKAQGLINHDATQQVDLGSTGVNINIQTATNDEIIAFFQTEFAELLDNNFIAQTVNLWVSPEIYRRFEKLYSLAGEFKEGTLRDYILKLGRIGAIKRTFLLKGNHMIAFVPNRQYVRAKIAAQVATLPIARTTPMDDYNFMIWGAFGLQVRRDFNGRSGVFNFYGNQVIGA